MRRKVRILGATVAVAAATAIGGPAGSSALGPEQAEAMMPYKSGCSGYTYYQYVRATGRGFAVTNAIACGGSGKGSITAYMDF